MPVASFQAILDKALADYCEQIGVELDKHPFIDDLRGTDSPDNVLELLEEKANAFKVYRDGNRKLINWLSPVVKVVHTLSGVLGQAVGVPFLPARAIFAGVDVLITAAGGVTSSYDALVDLFECIGNFLNRLRIYTDIPMTPSMTEIIVKIMVELLSVFALATKQIKQEKFAKKLLGESEIEAVLQRLDRLTQEEGRMTVVQTLEVVHGLVNNVKIVMNDGKASTDGIQKALDTMQQMASDINKMRRDQMQKDSKIWLCPPDPSKNYNIGCTDHHDGTATWFFQGSLFNEWNANGSFLWIHGKPGSGKSIFLSSIIRKINSKRKAGLALMAYFYFDFRDAEKQNLRGLLSSLVFQLSAKSDSSYQILSRLYSEHAGGTEEPSESVLSECLVEMLEVPGQSAMYIIIDALDECPNISGMHTAREKVLTFLEHLVRLNLPNVRICASSRPEIDIRITFEPLAPLRMSLHDESGQKEDISAYIKAVVNADQRMRRWRNVDKQLVINTLSDKADGMFRWVFCQLGVLRWTLPVDIRCTLDNVPKTLDETYERALLAINEEMRHYARRLFQCLAISIRPLRVEELADILAVRFDAGTLPKFNPDWRLGDAEEAVLSVCTNLISVVDVDGSQVVQFSHFSVKEFLTSNRLATAMEDLSGYHIIPHSAHTVLAQASLSVLLELDDQIDKDGIKNFPFSGYAAQHWVEHGQFEGVSPAIQVAMEHLFNPDKPHFSAWVWIYDMDDPWGGGMPTMHPERPDAVPLYYAVLCGFRQLVEHLIASYPGDVDARGGYHETPLFVAFIKEDIDIALSLIRRGANVNIIDESDWSPLHRASDSGRIDIVTLLLENNASVNLRNTFDDTPLRTASISGQMGVLRLLLQWGADVNCQDKSGVSPLHGATQSGHLEAVQFLIESGADMSLCFDDGRTPLYLASQLGHVKIAELLIQHGADVGSRDNDGRTPLHAASWEGHVHIAELLIQHGIDMGSLTEDSWTASHFACQNGQDKMAELLIQHGADVGSQGDDGWTPLHAASWEGHVHIAEMLIQHGVDMGSLTEDSWTALHLACQNGQEKMAELLIQHGADVGSRDNGSRTPLHMASWGGHVHIAELLIQRGVDKGSLTEDSRTALHFACQKGQDKMAELLIQHGADVCSRDNGGRTPLHAASWGGHVHIAELLIQHGVDMGSPTEDSRTALHLACQNGQGKMAELLLQHGADVGSRANDGWTSGWTPLHTASSQGHVHIAELLIQHGVDMGSLTEDSWTALHLACQNGQDKMAELLIQHGADVGSRTNNGQTPLDLASAEGHVRVAELLIQCGINAGSRDKDGWTPLHRASAEGHVDVTVAALLIQHGASVDSRNDYDWTPLHGASKAGYVNMAKLLIQHGADVGSPSNSGHTPLHIAAFHGHLDILRLLLECGADRDLNDNRNKTPLDLAPDNRRLEVANFLSRSVPSLDGKVHPTAQSIDPQIQCPEIVQPPIPRGTDLESSNSRQPSVHTASRNGQVDVVRSLLDHGSDIEEKDSLRKTALSLASEFGQLEVAILLIEREANVDSRDKNGSTALHWGSEKGQVEVVRLLLNHNADLNARNRFRLSALDYASRLGHFQIAELLFERGANVNVRNGFGRTPRQEALARGYGRIAELLSKPRCM